MKTSTRRMTGFTLLELMIVVVIIAILAALAMNSYRQYILRGNRTYATRALQDVASREENYYFSNNTYAASMTSLGAAGTAGSYYKITVPVTSATNYTIQADAMGTQVQDATCLQLQLTRAGEQKVTSGGGAVSACWAGQSH